MKVYEEYSKRWAESSREEIIRNGRGALTPAVATKHTKVQVVELTNDEFAVWLAAKERNAANLWNFTFPAKGAR